MTILSTFSFASVSSSDSSEDSSVEELKLVNSYSIPPRAVFRNFIRGKLWREEARINEK